MEADESIDKLISLVRSYSPLWDMRNKLYHSRDIQRKLWGRIAESTDDDVESLKKKWKGLRDSFRREYKKFLKSGQEAPDEFDSQWPYFNQMLFLTDVMQPRELKGNVSPPPSSTSGTSDTQDVINVDMNQELSSPSIMEDSNKNDSHSTFEVSEHSEPLLEQSDMAPPPHTPIKGKRKIMEMRNVKKRENEKRYGISKNIIDRNRDEEFLEIEKTKLKLFSESTLNKNDSEYQFLMSLHPYLKKVPPHRKLIVRNALSQVLIDEERYNSRTSLYTSHTSPGLSTWTSGSDGLESSASTWTTPERAQNPQDLSPLSRYENLQRSDSKFPNLRSYMDNNYS